MAVVNAHALLMPVQPALADRPLRPGHRQGVCIHYVQWSIHACTMGLGLLFGSVNIDKDFLTLITNRVIKS